MFVNKEKETIVNHTTENLTKCYTLWGALIIYVEWKVQKSKN